MTTSGIESWSQWWQAGLLDKPLQLIVEKMNKSAFKLITDLNLLYDIIYGYVKYSLIKCENLDSRPSQCFT